jgi:hypothetical protein
VEKHPSTYTGNILPVGIALCRAKIINPFVFCPVNQFNSVSGNTMVGKPWLAENIGYSK